MPDKRPPRPNRSLLGATAVLAALSAQLAHAGNTTCVSNQLSWYSDVVGESPCMTYQRLRQICNNDYQVPNFASTPPGDRCDDQVSECCCNMVAFQLSMLCMVCQQDKQDSGGIGIDAPVKGTYTVYRGSCGAGVNHTLPSDIQTAICNENIRIDNFLYDSWDDGTWFYVWTKEHVETLHAANNNNTFTHCPNQISPSATPTSAPPTSTSTSTAAQQTQTAVPTSQGSANNAPDTSTSTTSASTSASTSSRGASSVSGPSALNTSGSTGAPVPPTAGASTGESSSNSGSNASPQASDADFGAGGQSKSKSRTSIIGGVVGGVLGLLLVVLAPIFWRRRRRDAVRLRGISSDDYVGSGSTPPPPLGSLGPHGRPTSPLAHEDDPFMSTSMSEPSPRTLAFGTAVNPSGDALALTPSAPLTESSLRHHDGGPLSAAGLTRSGSGRLPPAYEDSWDSGRTTRTGGRTDPVVGSATAGSESAPTRSDFSRSDVEASEGETSRYGYGPAPRESSGLAVEGGDPFATPARRRALPVPGLAGATGRGSALDAKDPALFD